MNWREVTKDQFYAALGQQNVHPRIVNQYDHEGKGYISDWVLYPMQKIIGRTESGDFPFTERRYLLPT